MIAASPRLSWSAGRVSPAAVKNLHGGSSPTSLTLVVQLQQCAVSSSSTPLLTLLRLLLCVSSQGNQEATNPPEAMAQPYTPAQYPPPPQNGIPAEFAAPHPLPTQDYTGQSRVPEHAMTLYTPTQTHSEPAGTDNSTPAITATTTAPVSVLHHLQTLFSTDCQQVNYINIIFFYLFFSHLFT